MIPYIVKNAVLLDTQKVDKEKTQNSVLMHTFYSIADIGNGVELLKLYIEEMYDPNKKDDTHRAYQLQNIEKKQFGVKGSQSNSVSLITQTASARNIAGLYALVKQYDKDFH